jgi:hypothetical protein
MTAQEISNLTGLPASQIIYAATMLSIRLEQIDSNQDMKRLASYLRVHGHYHPDFLEKLEAIFPNTLLTEMKALDFSDRLAQLAMAVMYSANHIEVTSFIGQMVRNNNAEIRRKKDVIRSTLEAARLAYNTPPLDAEGLVAFTGLSARDVSYALANLRIEPHALSEVDLGRLNMFLKQHCFCQPEALVKLKFLSDGAYRDAQVLVRGDLQGPGAEAPITPVSEIDYDTTATAIVQERETKSLLIACNFKRRKMAEDVEKLSWNAGPNHGSFEYVDFGYFTEATINKLKAELTSELNDVRNNGDENLKSLAAEITQCKIVGRTERPTKPAENAGPHAEMQILNYCRTINEFGPGLYVGVSRPCCPRCSAKFDENRVTYTRRHGTDPARSWDDPNMFTTQVLHTFNL